MKYYLSDFAPKHCSAIVHQKKSSWKCISGELLLNTFVPFWRSRLFFRCEWLHRYCFIRYINKRAFTYDVQFQFFQRLHFPAREIFRAQPSEEQVKVLFSRKCCCLRVARISARTEVLKKMNSKNSFDARNLSTSDRHISSSMSIDQLKS